MNVKIKKEYEISNFIWSNLYTNKLMTKISNETTNDIIFLDLIRKSNRRIYVTMYSQKLKTFIYSFEPYPKIHDYYKKIISKITTLVKNKNITIKPNAYLNVILKRNYNISIAEDIEKGEIKKIIC